MIKVSVPGIFALKWPEPSSTPSALRMRIASKRRRFRSWIVLLSFFAITPSLSLRFNDTASPDNLNGLNCLCREVRVTERCDIFSVLGVQGCLVPFPYQSSESIEKKGVRAEAIERGAIDIDQSFSFCLRQVAAFEKLLGVGFERACDFGV